MSTDYRTVLNAVVENVVDRLEGPQSYYGEQEVTLDEAIDLALSADVDYGHHDATGKRTPYGNSWYRTTGRRMGITPRGVKQALRNRKLM